MTHDTNRSPVTNPKEQRKERNAGEEPKKASQPDNSINPGHHAQATEAAAIASQNTLPALNSNELAFVQKLMADPSFVWLRGENQRLEQCSKTSAESAQRVITLFTVLYTIIVGSLFAYQFLVISNINTTSDNLHNEIIEGKKQRDETSHEFRIMDQQTKKQIGEVTEANMLAMRKLTEQLSVLQRQEEESRKRIQNAVSATAKMNEALGLLHIGHQRLNESSSASAARYAQRALDIIDKESSRLAGVENGDTTLITSLAILKRPLWILQCESLVQMDEISQLSVVSANLASCECPEGSHYQAITKLDSASDERIDRAARLKLLSEGRALLERATTYTTNLDADPATLRQGNFDLVLLAAAYYDNGNIDSAKKLAEEFIAGFSKSDGSKGEYPGRISGQLVLARIWLDLCVYVESDEKMMPDPEQCIAAGVLHPVEGRILKSLLREARANRSELVGSDRAQALEAYCNKALETVNSLTQKPCRQISRLAIPAGPTQGPYGNSPEPPAPKAP